MSLRIYIIPTGDSIQSSGPPPTSLEGLRSWVAEATSIPNHHQILLTPKGRHVKLQTLLTETELYLYDRELFTVSNAKDAVQLSPLPEPWSPEDFPDTLSNQNSLKSWQTLFKERRKWAADVFHTCKAIGDKAGDCIAKRGVIDQGLRIATLTHDGHMRTLEQKYKEGKAWLEEISRETPTDQQAWQDNLAKIDSIPAIPAFTPFFEATETLVRKNSGKTSVDDSTLASFIDRTATTKAVTESQKILGRFHSQLQGCSLSIERMGIQYEELMKDLDTSQTRSLRDDPEEPSRQLQEVQVIANKIAADCEHVLGLTNDAKSLAQASKIALLHTKNFCPSLRECAKEMDDLLKHVVEQNNATVQRALQNLQTIASIESLLAAVTKDLSSLQIPDESIATFDRVSLIGRLPLVYGSLLLEATRRKEWVDKMKHDSAALAEELAGYQEEEQKRRKRWFKGVNDVIGEGAEGKVLGMEINLKGEDHPWPNISRQDLDDYMKHLQGTDGLESTVETLEQMIRDLDRPTKQQVKRAKAFKAGSLHEAGFGKGSLMIRGDDEVRLIKEANLKLEEEVRGYKSRIRKLEDLLHRQSHVNRLSMVNGSQNSPFAEPNTPITEADRQLPGSPRPNDSMSRRSSIASHRFSSNVPKEDKEMLRRVLQLESELASEKEARAALTKAAAARRASDETILRQIEEANSTKKDLLKNMEALQREFAEERRSLEDEISKYKLKVEEMEDELDRLLGSRDNERTGIDVKVQSLVAELEQLRQDAAEDLRKAENRASTFEAAFNRREELDSERHVMLKGVYSSLTDQPVPEDPTTVVSELEELAQRSANHVRELSQAVSLAKSENKNLQSLLESQRDDNSNLEKKLEEQEDHIRSAQEELASEKEKASSLFSELESEREHLKDLRSKFAEGETGSESLRQRIEEEQAKVNDMSAKLAEARSHVNGLDVELLSMQSKYRKLQDLYDASGARLHQRSQRAKSISQRLYAQNDRLNRLLETLGFSVTFQENGMAVARTSKSGASTVLGLGADGAASMHRSVAAPSSALRLLDDLSDLSPLLWMEKDSPEDEEAKFQDFMAKIDRFNLDTFSEAITKRIRDMEHTARKWQKEARAYRDKSQRVQSEAHERIAFRGFKAGDLALFLPTRNQVSRPWAAFNIGAPHYFLKEQDSFRLANRDHLVARITKIDERIVDLTKAMGNSRTSHLAADGRSITESEGGMSFEDDNPFDLSDGLRWYLLEAQEEKVGAPSTPGLGKATVSAANVDARGSIRISSSKKKTSDAVEEASKALSRSLDSRRSSQSSKKNVPVGLGVGKAGSNEALHVETPENGRSPGPGPSHLRTTSDAESMQPPAVDSGAPAAVEASTLDEVRRNLLWGP
ncbi:hypothetical protein E2P81_ATG04144 [Venturia nashicola]|uniref:Autophagy-related protein 11 n=1 Tax=Venturia nashicola TaxID=86259 RepID=A0A4Z1PA36_9PEZI|nr:hypothetical protein E6O75_ATG04243 [Venturia nashicola]TLD37332.1 hypothetical protein E2P81_ATG04144 [Venturia nashicola]